MEEKIKIYLPKNIYDTLIEDVELFEFFKRNGSLNKNEFVNLLIANYHDIYQKTYGIVLNKIKDTLLSETNLKGFDAEIVSGKILDIFEKNSKNAIGPKAEIALSITPTKVSSKTINFIKSNLNPAITLSNYFRNFFASYIRLPRNKRETILFKDTFEEINNAIKEKKMIYIVNKSNNAYKLSPYIVTSSREEIFNYLLAESEQKNVITFRMSRIRQVTCMNKSSSFEKNNIGVLKRMIEQGPQFITTKGEDANNIQIKLTEEGKHLYKIRYINKPKPFKIENDIYYFDCTEEQIKQYFFVFGKDAVVLSPKPLRDYMQKRYKEALDSYK